ncbi:MAG: T9SS type A sorting domain-containing protein [Bacteroidales bacterium]|nr:T9SS type A sorting domain-containing protein [Bacteroidales bacterium]
MKKNILILIIIGVSFYSFGQKATKMTSTNKYANVAVPAVSHNGDEVPSGPVISSNPTTQNRSIGPEFIIGRTKYDLQTNRSMSQRIFLLSNGKISAVWTFANSGTPWNDRGTGYNLMTGGAWSPYPIGTPITSMSRVEATKVGWANYGVTNNEGSEIIVAHNNANNKASIYTRATLGTGTWTEATDTFPMIWTKIATGGMNNNTVHLIATYAPVTTRFKNIYSPLIYTNSTDGGTTWTEADLLPGYTSTIVKKPVSENYAIDAKGSTVAIVVGGWYDDTYLFKSTDNGINWSKKLIWHFPNAPFNPDSSAMPATDTTACFDGSFSVVVDGSGKVHVWGGVTKITQLLDVVYYFPAQCGLIYWRDDMSTITGDLKNCNNFCWPWDNYVDRNENGKWDCTEHQGWIRAEYGVGGTSMPGGSIDPMGNLYVVFQHMSDADPNTFHIYGSDTVPYRHLFAISSTDNGTKWFDAVEITPFDEGREYVFPSVAKNSKDSLRVLYQEDDLPGTSLNNIGGHPTGYECDIVYLAVPYADCVGGPCGIEKKQIKSKIEIYPNPANTTITIEISQIANENTILIYNISGEEVAKVKGIRHKAQVDVADFPSGIYFVKIVNENGVEVVKFVKN